MIQTYCLDRIYLTTYIKKTDLMRNFKKLNLFILSILLLGFYGCDSNTSEDDLSGDINLDGTSRISVKLVDAPGDYESVFIDVLDVMIKMNDDSEDDTGWESIGANADVYDLLLLTGGLNAVLADDYEVQSGELSQIRLILGENNSVVIDGETFPLNTPSAQQSGLKIKINQVLESGFTYNFVLDFDVESSIVVAGNSGNINLKPVIRASAEFSSGKIQGAITPFDFQTMISVQAGDDLISTLTNELGVFVLNGVPAGTYDVTITPEADSGYEGLVLNGIEVVNGEITDVGTIELELTPTTGSITGTILNEGVLVTASIMMDGELVSVDTDETGVFLFENVTAGSYDVTLTPEDGSGLSETVVSDVVVVVEETTDLGGITLE